MVVDVKAERPRGLGQKITGENFALDAGLDDLVGQVLLGGCPGIAKQGGTIVQANMAATVWGEGIYEGRCLYKTNYWRYIHHVVITEWLPRFLAEEGGLFLCSEPYTGPVG